MRENSGRVDECQVPSRASSGSLVASAEVRSPITAPSRRVYGSFGSGRGGASAPSAEVGAWGLPS